MPLKTATGCRSIRIGQRVDVHHCRSQGSGSDDVRQLGEFSGGLPLGEGAERIFSVSAADLNRDGGPEGVPGRSSDRLARVLSLARIVIGPRP